MRAAGSAQRRQRVRVLQLKQLFVAKIIPYRGSWVEFEYDQKNLLYVRVGKRKFLASIFLRALGPAHARTIPQIAVEHTSNTPASP